ncbi:hypothetical protein [Gilliamella mensalis]|uniref:hypothetical protein n=1 Tax=Gilliamella mensalis TaxID=1908520 RepID=UPI000A16275B|nr:hypothetical protein [Gilliamella mensalis]
MSYCFVEGECEQKLVQELISSKKIKLSHIKKINMWESAIERHLVQIKRNDKIFVIFDTDVITPKRSDVFINNLRKLIKNGNKIVLLEQNTNFEDELCHCLALKLPLLFASFHAQGKNEFKKKFINNSTLIKKLTDLNIKWVGLWDRGVFHPNLTNTIRKNISVGNFLSLQNSKNLSLF